MSGRQLNIAVLIPCYNEASTISTVIKDFQAHLPSASIYVYDNNSGDGTAAVAQQQGAIVRHEHRRGKGHVVRRMFSDIEADLYILADGDATYSAADAPAMADLLVANHYDMVNGRRVPDNDNAYRLGHQFGNRMLTGLVGWIFGSHFTDILSGYRVFSRRYVKSFPALSTGFEIETELTVHALSLNMPVAETPVPYKERSAGSQSKLNTFRDGIRILGTILALTKEERPLFFFSVVFALTAGLALALGIPIIIDWLNTGLVLRFPTAMLAAALMILAFLSLSNGVLLSSVTRLRREMKRLHYLNLLWLGPSH